MYMNMDICISSENCFNLIPFILFSFSLFPKYSSVLILTFILNGIDKGGTRVFHFYYYLLIKIRIYTLVCI